MIALSTSGATSSCEFTNIYAAASALIYKPAALSKRRERTIPSCNEAGGFEDGAERQKIKSFTKAEIVGRLSLLLAIVKSGLSTGGESKDTDVFVDAIDGGGNEAGSSPSLSELLLEDSSIDGVFCTSPTPSSEDEEDDSTAFFFAYQHTTYLAIE